MLHGRSGMRRLRVGVPICAVQFNREENTNYSCKSSLLWFNLVDRSMVNATLKRQHINGSFFIANSNNISVVPAVRNRLNYRKRVTHRVVTSVFVWFNPVSLNVWKMYRPFSELGNYCSAPLKSISQLGRIYHFAMERKNYVQAIHVWKCRH